MSPELIVARMAEKGLLLATAESCTGGLVAAAITDVAGSSAVLDCGFVTYSNAAKVRMLGVPEPLLAAHGAVSAEVARAMTLGALDHCKADVAVAVTGIAGPGGGTAAKPVGLVHFACARRGAAVAQDVQQFGDLGRAEVRRAAVVRALELVWQAIQA